MKLLKYGMMAVAAAALALGARATDASTIQLIGTGTAGSGPFTYHFELELTPNNGLTNDASWESGIVVVDFPGFVSVTKVTHAGEVTASGDWVLSSPATGAGGMPNSAFAAGVTTLTGSSGGSDFVSLADTATNNIVMAYTGSGLGGSALQRNLIGLDIVSTVALSSSTFINTMSRDTNTVSGKIGEVETFSTISSAVPVPAAAWSGMSLLAGLGVLAKVRRKNRA